MKADLKNLEDQIHITLKVHKQIYMQRDKMMQLRIME
jgi:hypothetical protein